MMRRNITYQRLAVIGGEPFLHHDLAGFMAGLREGMVPGSKLWLVSNGFWMGGDLSKWKDVFRQADILEISLYIDMMNRVTGISNPDERVCRYNDLIVRIKEMVPSHDVWVRTPANYTERVFTKIEFTEKPEEPTQMCIEVGCVNLMHDGRLLRCAPAARPYFRPDVTGEFLDRVNDPDICYDLTVDDGASVKKWRRGWPLKACSYCTAWKRISVPWSCGIEWYKEKLGM